jgi:hypothetical protein
MYVTEIRKLKSHRTFLETALDFELFALAWMHRFAGKYAIAQSMFTKRYLQEKEKSNIWNSMEHYNEMVKSATLHWFTGLGKMNSAFWNNMRNYIIDKNIKIAKKIGLEQDEIFVRVTNRLCSEYTWEQRIILGGFVDVFCKRIEIGQLKDEAGFRLSAVIQGLYNGDYHALKNIKIKD